MNAIQQEVTIQTDGLLEIHSPELKPGDVAEVTIRIISAVQPPLDPTKIRDWRDFAGIFKGECGSSDNEAIDADLAKEYGSKHEPVE